MAVRNLGGSLKGKATCLRKLVGAVVYYIIFCLKQIGLETLFSYLRLVSLEVNTILEVERNISTCLPKSRTS